jgi:small subunit ribosomal protein S4
LQLREKQKVKRMYGLMEKQFRSLFHEADMQKGVTGSNLLVALESRFDNMVYRTGFAASKAEARQLVSHGHFLVNGKRVTIPSFRVRPGDVISVKDKSQQLARINESLETAASRTQPEWIELDRANFTATVKALPTREQLTHPMKEQLIVELYSK